MRNKIYTVIAVFGMFLGLVVSAHGQAATKVKVEIPFDFAAGKTTLHAGVYNISRTSANVITFRAENGKTAVTLNAPVTHSSINPNAVERLVFSKQGDRFFLSQIWLTADSGRQVWVDREGRKSETIEIALTRK